MRLIVGRKSFAICRECKALHERAACPKRIRKLPRTSFYRRALEYQEELGRKTG